MAVHDSCALEAPVFWLGAIGFEPGERSRLEHLVAHNRGVGIEWRFGTFSDADAWLINGARVRAVEGSHIRVAPGLPSERNMRLALTDVNRPCAFALPVPQDFVPLCQFDAACPASIEGLLQQLASWLQPLRFRIALGGEIMRRSPWMPRAVFHVHLADRLLAIVDLIKGRVGFAPNLTPQLLGSAVWSKRPPSAGLIPPQFAASSVPQLAWSYVRHTGRDWLPSRYTTQRIHYRGAPRVPLEWLPDTQLLLLQELRASSASLEDLRQRTGLPADQVRKELACLYVSGAITASAARAAKSPAVRQGLDGQPSSGFSSSLMGALELPATGLQNPARAPALRRDVTVPGPLMAFGA